MVEQSFDRCAVASLCTIQLRERVEGFMGSIMNYHGIKKGDWNSLRKSFQQVHRLRPNLLHGMSTAVFVGSRTVDSLLPPAFDELTSVEKWKLERSRW